MELTPENLDEDDCRPTPESFPIRIEPPDYMVQRLEAVRPAARGEPEA